MLATVRPCTTRRLLVQNGLRSMNVLSKESGEEYKKLVGSCFVACHAIF